MIDENKKYKEFLKCEYKRNGNEDFENKMSNKYETVGLKVKLIPSIHKQKILLDDSNFKGNYVYKMFTDTETETIYICEDRVNDFFNFDIGRIIATFHEIGHIIFDKNNLLENKETTEKILNILKEIGINENNQTNINTAIREGFGYIFSGLMFKRMTDQNYENFLSSRNSAILIEDEDGHPGDETRDKEILLGCKLENDNEFNNMIMKMYSPVSLIKKKNPMRKAMLKIMRSEIQTNINFVPESEFKLIG